jgi:hypothetical protein
MEIPSLADRVIQAIRTGPRAVPEGPCVATPQALAVAAGCTMKEARKTVELLAKRGRLKVTLSPYWQVSIIEDAP